MKKLKLLFAVVCFLGALFLTVSCQEKVSLDPSVSKAKVFFEQNAQNLSLPVFGKANEQLLEMASSVHPVWEEALLSYHGETTIIEVPLTGPCRIEAAIVKVHDNHTHIERAASKSYLVLRIEGDSKPSMFVETFIQQGKACTMTAFSNRDNILGFEILSDLSGSIRTNQVIKEGVVSLADETTDLTRAAQLKHDFVGYRAGYAVTTKDHIGCPDYAWIYCPFCETLIFINFADLDPRCPNCGARFLNGVVYCSECGRPIDHCSCIDNEACNVCGRNKANCNGCSDTSYYCECD